MREVEKAYLAGIVDGEGTVTLMKHHKNETPTPSVSIANNSLRLLEWIKTKVGGVIVSKRNIRPTIMILTLGLFVRTERYAYLTTSNSI